MDSFTMVTLTIMVILVLGFTFPIWFGILNFLIGKLFF